MKRAFCGFGKMGMIRQTESGRSMIEMLGVLAIVGILSAGGIVGYKMAMSNYRANKAMGTFQDISARILTTYLENEDFSEIANDVTALNIDLSSPYGGNVSVNGGNGYFTLAMGNIPQDACIKIAQGKWGSDYVLGTSDDAAKFTKNPFDCANGKSTMVLKYQPEIATTLNAGNEEEIAGGEE